MTTETLSLRNGVRIELLFEGRHFKGMGAIGVGEVSLRGSHRPMFVEIRTPDGVEFFDFTVVDKKETAEGVVLEFGMKARASGIKDWMVHAVRNLVVTRDWAEPEWVPSATLKLHLRGIEKTFANRGFAGFGYFYEYKSADHPIYRLLDRSSWALNGSVAGHSFWLRSSFAPSIRHFASSADFYSSEWYLGSARNPNIFQFQPFQTNLESFTMTAAETGQLLTIAPKLAHIRSLFEKPRGSEEILHWHEHCGDLASRFVTTPIQVLFSNHPASGVELINLHHAVKNQISEDLHWQAGLRRERITTYGVIEEWSRPDLNDYVNRILPKVLETGVRCVYLPSEFRNNTNVWNVSNMCCTVDYKMDNPAEEEKLRRFCAHARAAGVTVQMWGNTALSSLDFILRPQQQNVPDRVQFLPVEDSIFELLDQVKDAYVRNPSGAIEADHYTPVFMVLNLRDPAIRAYWNRHWKEAHDSIGLGGIFLDSSFNLSSDKFHYIYNTEAERTGVTADQSHLLGQTRPEREPPKAILSMYFAHLQLVSEMQGYGYHYSGEDVGVFGLRRSGPGVEKRLDNLFLWEDCYVSFGRREIIDAGRDPDEIFFQGLAYRMMWTLYWNFNRQVVSFAYVGRESEDDPTPWHLGLIRAFNEVEARMLNRTVLEGEKGVVYEFAGGQVLWAFSEFHFELPRRAKVREILANAVFEGDSLAARKHHVYLIESRQM